MCSLGMPERTYYPRLYVLVSRSQELSVLEQILQSVPEGSTWVQLRAPTLNARDLQGLALTLRRITRDFGAPFLVNDRVDVAMAVGACGVHLKHDSLSVRAVRALWPEALVGRSCNSPDEVFQASEEEADFAVLGPIYDTPSKSSIGQSALGVRTLKAARLRCRPSFPIVAIGGVTESNIRELWTQGASGVAVVRALMQASSPPAIAREILLSGTPE